MNGFGLSGHTASKIKYVEGDLFKHVLDGTEPTIICHVVNDRGAWGAGFVVPLARHFPAAEVLYRAWASEPPPKTQPFELGETQTIGVRPKPEIIVANMLAQHDFPSRANPVAIKYDALEKCMKKVAEIATQRKATISAPLFGSGLAGGDPVKIEQMMQKIWVDAGIPVTVYYLPGTLPTGLGE